jgi:hypothetical protein
VGLYLCDDPLRKLAVRVPHVVVKSEPILGSDDEAASLAGRRAALPIIPLFVYEGVTRKRKTLFVPA